MIDYRLLVVRKTLPGYSLWILHASIVLVRKVAKQLLLLLWLRRVQLRIPVRAFGAAARRVGNLGAAFGQLVEHGFGTKAVEDGACVLRLNADGQAKGQQSPA